MWECSMDMAQHLLLNDSIDKTGMSPPGAVLELGCGIIRSKKNKELIIEFPTHQVECHHRRTNT